MYGRARDRYIIVRLSEKTPDSKFIPALPVLGAIIRVPHLEPEEPSFFDHLKAQFLDHAVVFGRRLAFRGQVVADKHRIGCVERKRL